MFDTKFMRLLCRTHNAKYSVKKRISRAVANTEYIIYKPIIKGTAVSKNGCGLANILDP